MGRQMSVVVHSVRSTAAMVPRWMCVALLYTFTAVLGSAGGHDSQDKRSKAVWYRAKFDHEGSGLSNEQLRTVAAMEDMQHFRKMLAPILVPRVVGTEGHTRVRQHLVNTMNSLGWTVEEDRFDSNTPVGRKTFTNVIATLNPDAPRHLILACHYDSKLDREGEFIGATDSAVPCAMLLNLAFVMREVLSQHSKMQSDLTLRFIFIDGEEAFRLWSDTDSLYGARHMAANLEARAYPTNNAIGTNELHRMDLFVLLDLLGTADVKFFNYFEETSPWYMRLVSYERRLREMQLLHARKNYIFQNRDLFHAGIQDDHIPFLKRGVPVLHLIPMPFPKVWHKNTDREEALHYGTIESLNKLMRTFVADYLHLVL
uniref:Glutaminyl-peptide cyclotransferase n=1 Tax=Scylla paramamosain TaxID=85552 RepID=A0A411NJR3_SCYPA|nr:glutaminyl-peptide cyclotransferase [Scylla paramamosain]